MISPKREWRRFKSQEDKIEILPKSVNFENSISFLETAQEEFGFAWAEGFYKIINILYRYRINPVKFDATLEKYQKKLHYFNNNSIIENVR